VIIDDAKKAADLDKLLGKHVNITGKGHDKISTVDKIEDIK